MKTTEEQARQEASDTAAQAEADAELALSFLETIIQAGIDREREIPEWLRG
jgi:hypothetical protein